jgi:hypothetical protein
LQSFAFQKGDRIATLSQSVHNELKTPWTDFPLHQMPRFDVSESFITICNLPVASSQISTSYRIDPNHDLKVSLSFAVNKFIIPWIIVFDANKRVSLRKLTIIFTRDEFDIVGVRFETICKFLIIFIFIIYVLMFKICKFKTKIYCKIDTNN